MSTFTSRIISRLQRGWTLWQAVRLELVVWWRTRVVRVRGTPNLPSCQRCGRACSCVYARDEHARLCSPCAGVGCLHCSTAPQWRAVPVACPCGERGSVVEPVDPAVRRVRWECPRCMRLTAEEVRDERPI